MVAGSGNTIHRTEKRPSLFIVLNCYNVNNHSGPASSVIPGPACPTILIIFTANYISFRKSPGVYDVLYPLCTIKLP